MKADSNAPFLSQNLAAEDCQLLFFDDDGATPNNRLPVLFYHLRLRDDIDRAVAFEQLFERNDWTPLWRDGIFDYQHFHPNAHEALGVAQGSARVKLGGEAGEVFEVNVGDVVVLPAGTGHCCVESSRDFLVVGAYPKGQEQYAIQRPGTKGHADALNQIAKVPDPLADPVTGASGTLVTAWRVGEA